eukprot:scaffold42567_cov18-Tisochrysis_lutea.AAC.1
MKQGYKAREAQPWRERATPTVLAHAVEAPGRCVLDVLVPLGTPFQLRDICDGNRGRVWSLVAATRRSQAMERTKVKGIDLILFLNTRTLHHWIQRSARGGSRQAERISKTNGEGLNERHRSNCPLDHRHHPAVDSAKRVWQVQ